VGLLFGATVCDFWSFWRRLISQRAHVPDESYKVCKNIVICGAWRLWHAVEWNTRRVSVHEWWRLCRSVRQTGKVGYFRTKKRTRPVHRLQLVGSCRRN